MLNVGPGRGPVLVGPIDTGWVRAFDLSKPRRAFVAERIDEGRTASARKYIKLCAWPIEIAVVVQRTKSPTDFIGGPLEQLHEVGRAQEAVLGHMANDGEIVRSQSKCRRVKPFESRPALVSWLSFSNRN